MSSVEEMNTYGFALVHIRKPISLFGAANATQVQFSHSWNVFMARWISLPPDSASSKLKLLAMRKYQCCRSGGF